MDLSVITLPYHLGHEGAGMGAGPDHFLQAGAQAVVASAGRSVRRAERVTAETETTNEVGNVFATLKALTHTVRATREEGLVPLVLAGNCNSAIGVMAALAPEGATGLVWFDAHGDANTPETTETGFFDGMPLAVISGWCWATMAASVPGFAPVPEEMVLHVGGRAFDDQERSALSSSAMTVVEAAALGPQGGRTAIAGALQRLASTCSGVHLHVDLDVIDTTDGLANEHAEAGGASLDELEAAILAVGQSCRVRAATLSSYNPGVDGDRRALGAGRRLLHALAQALED